MSDTSPRSPRFFKVQTSTPHFDVNKSPSVKPKESQSVVNYESISAEDFAEVLGHHQHVPSPSINDRSKQIHRSKPIYDHLLESGKKTDEKRERLRSEQMADFIEGTVNQNTIDENRISDIQARFQDLERERKEKLQKARENKEKEVEQYTFKPKISEKSANLAGREDQSTLNKAWQEEREAKLNAKREKAKSDISEDDFVPKLNPRTLKLVNRIKARKRKDVAGYSQQHYLEQRDFEKRQSNVGNSIDEEQFGTPRITPQAAMLIREGSASDRLYAESFRLNKTREENTSVNSPAQTRESSTTSSPRATLLSPSKRDVNSSSQSDLYRRAEEERRLKKELQEQREAQKQKEFFSPKINEVSQEIASKLPTSSYERLLTQREQPKPQEYSFKPTLNPKSRAMENEKKGVWNASPNDRVEHLLSQHERSQERLKTLRQEKEEKELQDCTFSPRTKAVHGGHTEHHYGPKKFHDRVSQWDRKRKAKVNRERRATSKDDLIGCTFSPDLSKTKNAPRVNTPDSGVHGADEFILRQNVAREKKEKQLQGVYVTGENWKHRITKPKEFVFNKKNDKIKSLDKPASPKKTPKKEEIDEKFEGLTLSDFGINFSDDSKYEDVHDEIDDYETYLPRSPVHHYETNLNVPPQGIFSHLSSVSILETTRQPPRSPSEVEDEQYEEEDDDDNGPSEEWIKRSKEKKEKEK